MLLYLGYSRSMGDERSLVFLVSAIAPSMYENGEQQKRYSRIWNLKMYENI